MASDEANLLRAILAELKNGSSPPGFNRGVGLLPPLTSSGGNKQLPVDPASKGDQIVVYNAPDPAPAAPFLRIALQSNVAARVFLDPAAIPGGKNERRYFDLGDKAEAVFCIDPRVVIRMVAYPLGGGNKGFADVAVLATPTPTPFVSEHSVIETVQGNPGDTPEFELPPQGAIGVTVFGNVSGTVLLQQPVGTDVARQLCDPAVAGGGPVQLAALPRFAGLFFDFNAGAGGNATALFRVQV